MSTYIIGDIHGCLDQLKTLLKKINYNPQQDHLGFVGDIVNRGPQSLETLRYIKSLNNISLVLGNHDLHLLALAYKAISRTNTHPLQVILDAPDKIELIEWLRHQPLFQQITDHQFMAHAGIPPQWTIPTTQQNAEHAEQLLQSNLIKKTLSSLYKNIHTEYSFNSKKPCPEYTMLALTQMRKCSQNGTLDLKFKHPSQKATKPLKPWFEWYQQKASIIFGHWAELKGQSTNPLCIATDTGCVWGHHLSAYHLEEKTFITTPGLKNQ